MINKISALFIIAFIDIICTTNAFAQVYCDLLYDNNWVLGDADDSIDDRYGGSIIEYFPQFVVQKRRKQSSQAMSFAVISSRGGNLLFYSNGCNIFDSRDSIIKGGFDLNPGEIHDLYCVDGDGYPGLNSMFFLPSSYDTSIYYLFHIGEIFNKEPNALFLVQHSNFYATTLHLAENLDSSEVIDKNKIIFSDTGMLGTPSVAVRHANGMDWWIITPDRWSNGFYTILLDETGPHYLNKQFIGAVTDPKATGGEGKFSPDGKHFAWYHPRNGLFLYDFDRTTGELSNFQLIEIPEVNFITGGCEFSPSGRFLYINQDSSLFQLDVLASDIQASLKHIADYDGFVEPLPTFFFYMQRTPDKRIFMNVLNGSQYLHVIEKPDVEGVGCDFKQHSIKLPTVNNFSLPLFPNYRLGSSSDPLCDSMMVNTEYDNDALDATFKIMPNPATDYFTLFTDDSQWNYNYSVYVMDILGRVKIKASTNRISIESLTQGIYYVTISLHGKLIFRSPLVVEKN